jgi:alkylation response protein AidB-like acyl-CoA dehydrogenase
MSVTALSWSEDFAANRSRQRADELIAFLRDYASRRVSSRLIDERRGIPPNVVLDLAREGLFGLQVEARYGGQALSYTDTFRVLEQSAAVDPNIHLLLCVHYAIGTPPIQSFAKPSVKEAILPAIATGRTLATIAASEPGAGAHLGGISTTARKLPHGGYQLDGDKCWISLGSWAGYVSVFAQLVDEKGQRQGMTGFVVEQGTPGFQPGAEALTLGMKGIPQNQIALRGLRLPASSLLGEEGAGATVAQSAFMMGRAVVAISAVGVMKRCLQLSARYARRREVATGNLFENGLTLDLLSDSVTATSAVEAMAYDLVDGLDRGHEPPPALYVAAKVLGSELMWRVIDRSVQLLGARGFMDTNVVGQYFRDMRLLRIFEGPTESMTLYLGSLALKDEARFLRSLAQEFGSVPAGIEVALAEARALFAPRLRDPATAKQAGETLAARVGELVAWAIMGAVLARSTRQPERLAATTRSWCARQFMARLSALQTECADESGPSMPSSDCLTEQIDGWTSEIGFIEQQLAGEERDLDPRLREAWQTPGGAPGAQVKAHPGASLSRPGCSRESVAPPSAERPTGLTASSDERSRCG